MEALRGKRTKRAAVSPRIGRHRAALRSAGRAAIAVLAAMMTALALASCGSAPSGPAALPAYRSIALNRVMEDISWTYQDVLLAIEGNDREGVQLAADELLRWFDDPAVAGYSSASDYGSAREAAVQAVKQLSAAAHAVGTGADLRSLHKPRKQVKEACDACHREHR